METQAHRWTVLWWNSWGKLCIFYSSARNLPCTLKALRIPASSKDACLTPCFPNLFPQSPHVAPVESKCSGEGASSDGIMLTESKEIIAFADD